MDWDRLKTFYHVATAGSISRAMDTIHLSQSAITRQIQSLEHSLKTKLFKRHTKGITLTEQGSYLFEKFVKKRYCLCAVFYAYFFIKIFKMKFDCVGGNFKFTGNFAVGMSLRQNF